MNQPERRQVMEPPKECSPRLGQVVVEIRVLLQQIRTVYGLERRNEGNHGLDRTHEGNA